jgi:hypothetical protein
MSISAWGYWEGWTGCAQRFDHGRACQSTADQNEIGIFHFKRTALHLSVSDAKQEGEFDKAPETSVHLIA